jgi:hypothetical protein
MSSTEAVISGVAGAAALNVAHQALQGATVDAPRMEVLGMRAMKKGFEAAGANVPPRKDLYPLTLIGDLISNSGYYSLVGLTKPENALLAGTALGLAAGVGAVALPGPIGLGTEPSTRTPQTTAMTIGLYLLGGVVAGLTYSLMSKRR